MVKATPVFFEKLLQELNEYNIENMLFIDDSINKIESARKHSIRSVLYKSNKQVELELIKNV